MNITKDIHWFKNDIAPLLKEYEIIYKYFEKGDFGSLNQVELNSTKIGGNIDFWGLGWLGIFVFDYEANEQLYNILLETGQEDEKEKAFERLLQLL